VPTADEPTRVDEIMFNYAPDPNSLPSVEDMQRPAVDWTGADDDMFAELFDIETEPKPTEPADPSGPKTTKDLVRFFDKDKIPWQHQKYSVDNSLWQSAALRRRAHPRRTNVSLGVCSCDLSGPHIATPRPGKLTHKDPCYYFLVLTVRPDMTAATCDTGTRYETHPGPAIIAPEATRKAKPALVYAALLGTKDEATDAIKRLLAQINNEHANYPTEIIFRFHSDQGGEFMSRTLKEYLIDKGIKPTTTAGYDPNANPAEAFVGILKRRTRYLLGGCRIPINWWGMGVLASAQLCRADAGLGEYPAIPFGTRVMVVKDPPPVSAFMPRAEPGTIFGPCEFISGSCWTYQHGLVKARTNIQPAGLSDDDLTWQNGTHQTHQCSCLMCICMMRLLWRRLQLLLMLLPDSQPRVHTAYATDENTKVQRLIL